jgi:hypothetical protein
MELRELLRMTRTRLIEEAVKIPDITGAHGMTKEQLVQALAKAHAIDLGAEKGQQEQATIGHLKKEIRNLKSALQEVQKDRDTKKREVLRKKLKRLKHQTRVLAGRPKPQAA